MSARSDSIPSGYTARMGRLRRAGRRFRAKAERLACRARDPSHVDGEPVSKEPEPIEVRKATLASILRESRPGVHLNEHLEHDCGLTVFQRYRSGRSPDWLKFKNPEAPAVKRRVARDRQP